MWGVIIACGIVIFVVVIITNKPKKNGGGSAGAAAEGFFDAIGDAIDDIDIDFD